MMQTFNVKRRPKDSFDSSETVPMQFENLTQAISWMEEENERDDRQYDIAAVSLYH